MEIGMFEKESGDPKIKNIAERILPDILIDKIYRVCERYGENEDEIREYDAYKLVSSSGNMFLKKASELEAVNYEKYLSQGEFKVPEFFGKTEENGETWILDRREGYSGGAQHCGNSKPLLEQHRHRAI